MARAAGSALQHWKREPFKTMKIKESINSEALRAADLGATTQRNGWWRPQFYRSDDSELIAASCHHDQLTVTIANKDPKAVGRIAVTAD